MKCYNGKFSPDQKLKDFLKHPINYLGCIFNKQKKTHEQYTQWTKLFTHLMLMIQYECNICEIFYG